MDIFLCKIRFLSGFLLYFFLLSVAFLELLSDWADVSALVGSSVLCYCVYRVYREITNEMFSLTQSKLYISKFLGPIKVIKKDLNNG